MATALLINRNPVRRWRLASAGNFAITDLASGSDVTPRSRKACAIIAYLASHPGTHVPRERVAELLWGDRGETQARASLRQALVEIRHAVPGEPALIGVDRGHLWINPESVDVSEDAASDGGSDFLPFEDLNHISHEFDDWLAVERTRRARHASEKLRHEIERLLAAGKGPSSFELIEAMWRIDPFDEDALRLALQAEYQAGHPAGIEQRYQAMVQRLSDELGVEPSADTKALHDRLLADLRSRKDFTPISAVATKGEDGQPGGRSWRSASAVVLVVAAAVALTGMWPRQVANSEQRRIAVLPFRAMDGVDPTLAEGMAGELQSHLSRQRDIDVIGRTSSWMFKDKAGDLRRIGRRLDADFVVEGSVRRAGSMLRATVALIDTSDATTIWSQNFESPSGNAQLIEKAAGSALSKQLGLSLVSAGAARTNPQAYANYVRAKSLIRDRNWATMRQAEQLLREAVKLDPNFAPAWAQLGGVINFIGEDSSSNAPRNGWKDEALEAARRAVALDPNLAEGHAMLAFIHGFDTKVGYGHLRRAIQLDPNNPQTLYWLGISAAMAGNFQLQEQLNKRALELDPLWRRPIEVAGQDAIYQGRRADAYRYLDRLRTADHDAAVEIEMSFAGTEGDLSHVVEVGRKETLVASTTGAKLTLAGALMELGYTREALLLGSYPDRVERDIYLRQLPGRDAILAYVRPFAGSSDEGQAIGPLIVELARTGRDADVTALYDQPESTLRQLGDVWDGNRETRLRLAGLVGWSLARSGRMKDAAQLFRAADEAGKVFMANRPWNPDDYFFVATNDAIRGRNAEALARLEQAVAKGWFTIDGMNYDIGELPWFAALKGNPRFEKLRSTIKAHKAKERRETEALDLI